MAGLVAQYQQGAFTTPINATLADASVVLSNDNNTRTKHNSHDSDPTIHVQSSVLASRPAAGTAQRIWITTDGLRAYVDGGASWSEVAYLPLVGGTVTGAVTISSGGLTVSAGTTAVQALTATTGVFSSTLSATGDLAINTNKFTVTAASGNVLTAGIIQLGGTTSSFPALKRNAASLEVRLADDSAYAQLNASAIGVQGGSLTLVTAGSAKIIGGTVGISFRNNADNADNLFIADGGDVTARAQLVATTNVIAGASSLVGFNGRSIIKSPSDGTLTLSNNAATSFNLLQFGGTTSSFPALRRSATNLEARFADDSAYAPFSCGALTAVTGNMTVTTGGVQTAAAGGGGSSAVVKIGSIAVTPVVLDTTRAIWAEIGGTTVKIAIVT